MVESQIINIFPTPIGIFDLGRELSKTEINFFNSLKYRNNNGNTTSVNNNVLHKQALTRLNKFFKQSIAEYCRFTFDFKNDIELYITQSWTNKTLPNEFHHKHVHRNSIISGVFYIDVDQDFDSIQFHQDNVMSKNLSFDSYSTTDYNCFNYWLPTHKGRLLLFPSSLEHDVPLKQGNNTRVSLAFNTFAKGTFGNNVELTELVL
jgi:uncharacterized protein (TIGR02466 family)